MNTIEIIETKRQINLKETLFSGQTFRWESLKIDSSTYISMIGNTHIQLQQIGNNKIRLCSSSPLIDGQKPTVFFNEYCSLDIDERLCFSEEFRRVYPVVSQLAEPYMGVRVLRLNPFETLITFMCAQAIGMNLIRKQIRTICNRFGERHMTEIDGNPLIQYSFPSPETLAAASPQDLRICTNNNCERASNIISAARAVAEGRLCMDELINNELSLGSIRNSLTAYRGIGLKIADCVMLFGLHRHDAFPIDTHVRQYLGKWFGLEKTQKALTPKTYIELQHQVSEILNPENAGYAGHILFHCWRNEVRHMNSF